MSIRLVMPGLRFSEAMEDPDPALRLAARGVAGFCVFGGDARLAGLLARLRDAAPHPLILASDMEQGVGQQVQGGGVHPPAGALDAEAAEAAGLRTALEARPIGITMVFAPVCDVLSNPRNPIIQARAFPDPARAAPRFVLGARRGGLRTCAKHFPGHGAAGADSHAVLPRVDDGVEVWRERDLPPFRACIEAGVDAVMTAHVACPAWTDSPDLPATLSRAVVTDLLRGELGFSGLVVTDALLMEGVRAGRGESEAARLALDAGCDLLLCPSDLEGVIAVAEDSAEPGPSLARVEAAAEPLSDPMDAAADSSVEAHGPLPVGPGPHALRIVDLDGAGSDLARAAGVAFEHYDAAGRLLDRGGEGGLAVPAVALLRSDRAWGGELELPAPVRALARGAGLLLLLGPAVLAKGLDAPARIRAPGRDPRTVRAVVRRAFAAPRHGGLRGDDPTPGGGPSGPLLA
jgi:beta-glucosidase